MSFTKEQLQNALKKPTYFETNISLISGGFDRKGISIFSGTANNKFLRWDFKTGSTLEKKGHDSWITGVHAHGESVYTRDAIGTVIKWKASDLSLEKQWNPHTKWIRDLAFGPHHLVTAGEDR